MEGARPDHAEDAASHPSTSTAPSAPSTSAEVCAMRRSVASAYSCSAGESEERSASLFARFASAGEGAPSASAAAAAPNKAPRRVTAWPAAGTPAARDSAESGDDARVATRAAVGGGGGGGGDARRSSGGDGESEHRRSRAGAGVVCVVRRSEDQQRVIEIGTGPSTSNNDASRAKSASAQIFSRIEISRVSSCRFFRLVHRGLRQKKNQPGGARVRRRSFVDRNLYHNTTQHPQQHNTTSLITKEKIVTHPRFLYQDIGVDPKERLPSRVVVPVGHADADKRRDASRPFFQPRRALNPKPRDARRYLRFDLGPTRTVARRSASASPPRRPRAAGPRARRGASPRAPPTSRGAPAARSARP